MLFYNRFVMARDLHQKKCATYSFFFLRNLYAKKKCMWPTEKNTPFMLFL